MDFKVDGGKLRGQAEQSEVRKEELVQSYLQFILVGLKEVQDNLGATVAGNAHHALLSKATVEAQEAYRIASVRYRAGSDDLLTLPMPSARNCRPKTAGSRRTLHASPQRSDSTRR